MVKRRAKFLDRGPVELRIGIAHVLLDIDIENTVLQNVPPFRMSVADTILVLDLTTRPRHIQPVHDSVTAFLII